MGHQIGHRGHGPNNPLTGAIPGIDSLFDEGAATNSVFGSDSETPSFFDFFTAGANQSYFDIFTPQGGAPQGGSPGGAPGWAAGGPGGAPGGAPGIAPGGAPGGGPGIAPGGRPGGRPPMILPRRVKQLLVLDKDGKPTIAGLGRTRRGSVGGIF